MVRMTRWYDLLTLDHSVCRICFAAGVRGEAIAIRAVRGRYMFRNRGAWKNSLRAAFRAHVAEVHPEWAVRIEWTMAVPGYVSATQ